MKKRCGNYMAEWTPVSADIVKQLMVSIVAGKFGRCGETLLVHDYKYQTHKPRKKKNDPRGTGRNRKS